MLAFINTVGCLLGGLGLGFGIAGNTDTRKMIGWISCAIGFGILHFTGFTL